MLTKITSMLPASIVTQGYHTEMNKMDTKCLNLKIGTFTNFPK